MKTSSKIYKSDHGIDDQGPVCIRHSSHKFPPSSVILWVELGGKPKWLPFNFGYHDVMQTGPFQLILLSSKVLYANGQFFPLQYEISRTQPHCMRTHALSSSWFPMQCFLLTAVEATGLCDISLQVSDTDMRQ